MVVSQNRNNGNAGEPSGNWCLNPTIGDASAGSGCITPGEKIENVCAKSYNLVHFWPENGANVVRS